MSLTEMQIQRELEKAVREGRHAEAEQLRFLLAEVTGERVAPPSPGQTYTLQEGDDVFGISETYLGGLEYVPDFLAANPDSRFTAGEEVVLPSVGGDANDEEDQLSVQLVELFETKGPPNDSWTAEDYALLEAVQAAAGTGQGGGLGADGGGGASAQGGQTVADDEEAEETEERIPAGSTALIDLPAEDAEVIAQFMAQMIVNGVVPDESAWGPVGRENDRAVEGNGQSEVETEADPGSGLQDDDGLTGAQNTGATSTPDWTPVPVATPIPAAQTTPTSSQEGGEPTDYRNLPGPAVCETTASCPPKDSGLDWSDPATHLKWYARGFYDENERIRYDDGLNDLEVMAQIAEEAANVYGGEGWDTGILRGLSEVFSGGPFEGATALAQAATNGDESIYRFGDSGFHEDFRDGHNQVFHVWPYLVSAADGFAGRAVAITGNYVHEIGQAAVRPLSNFLGLTESEVVGESLNDFVLSIVGMEIGSMINRGQLLPSELGETLRDRFGERGGGSEGLIDHYERLYPKLERN